MYWCTQVHLFCTLTTVMRPCIISTHVHDCYQVLEQARFSIRGDMFPEVERTCLFVGELARYGREWRLHLPDTLNNILVT